MDKFSGAKFVQVHITRNWVKTMNGNEDIFNLRVVPK